MKNRSICRHKQIKKSTAYRTCCFANLQERRYFSIDDRFNYWIMKFIQLVKKIINDPDMKI